MKLNIDANENTEKTKIMKGGNGYEKEVHFFVGVYCGYGINVG